MRSGLLQYQTRRVQTGMTRVVGDHCNDARQMRQGIESEARMIVGRRSFRDACGLRDMFEMVENNYSLVIKVFAVSGLEAMIVCVCMGVCARVCVCVCL